jgi:subtilase family serine protease
MGAVALMGAVGCGTPEETAETSLAQSLQALVPPGSPDFIIKSVKGPVSLQQGEDFTAVVTVCNQGTQQGAHADIELYLSVDAVITVPSNPGPYTDQPAGIASSEFLEPGACQTLSVEGQAAVFQPGAYYLGAVADPRGNVAEVRETNNSKVGNRLGVGNAADFIVSEVTGPASARPGEPITVSARVCNQGTEPGSTEVALFVSEDNVIEASQSPGPASDVFLDSAPVEWLEPGGCRTVKVTTPAPSREDGPYYLGAVADPNNQEPEFLEDNNAKAGSRLGLGLRPDFIVSKVTAPPSAEGSQPLVASVTVCNQGTEPGSPEVMLYLSEDKVITGPTPEQPGDVLVVPYLLAGWLEPGQCRALAVTAPVPGVPAGAYYLGAVVNAQNGDAELIADNNTKVSSRFGVGAGADFTVTQVTGPASVERSGSLTASVTVCNEGTREGSTEVEVYLSTDTTLTVAHPPEQGSDFLLGHASVPSLSPGQCRTLPVQGPTPSGDAYYLGAVVDSWGNAPELVEDNNTKVGGRVAVGSGPDFVVTQVTGPASVDSGDSFQASVTVCNQGTSGGGTDVALYLSEDTVLTVSPFSHMGEDVRVGTASVEYLQPGMCQTMPVQGQAFYAPRGSAYLGAVVNLHGGAELLSDNNTKVGARLGIGQGTDFIVTKVTGPARVNRGEPIMASVTVCNQGTSGGSAPVELYLSEDAVLTPSTPYRPSWEPRVGMSYTSYLEPGGCQTLTVQGNPWVDRGAYYLAAQVNPHHPQEELIADNNTKVGKTVAID